MRTPAPPCVPFRRRRGQPAGLFRRVDAGKRVPRGQGSRGADAHCDPQQHQRRTLSNWSAGSRRCGRRNCERLMQRDADHDGRRGSATGSRLHSLARDFLLEPLRAAACAGTGPIAYAASRAGTLSTKTSIEAADHALAAGDEALGTAPRSPVAVDVGRAGAKPRRPGMVGTDSSRHARPRDAELRISAAMIFAISDRNEEALAIAREVIDDPTTTPEMLHHGAPRSHDGSGLRGPARVVSRELVTVTGSNWPTSIRCLRWHVPMRCAFALLHAGQTRRSPGVLPKSRVLPTADVDTVQRTERPGRCCMPKPTCGTGSSGADRRCAGAGAGTRRACGRPARRRGVPAP